MIQNSKYLLIPLACILMIGLVSGAQNITCNFLDPDDNSIHYANNALWLNYTITPATGYNLTNYTITTAANDETPIATFVDISSDGEIVSASYSYDYAIASYTYSLSCCWVEEADAEQQGCQTGNTIHWQVVDSNSCSIQGTDINDYDGEVVKVSYTYSYNNPQSMAAKSVLTNTSTGISGFFGSINPVYAILAVLVIILVLVVLVRVVGGNSVREDSKDII